jgi:hypothetical protein
LHLHRAEVLQLRHSRLYVLVVLQRQQQSLL